MHRALSAPGGMISTLGAPLHSLLSLLFSKAGYHSCAISSQLTVAQESAHTCARAPRQASGAPARYKTHQSREQPAEDLRVIWWLEGRNRLSAELQGKEAEAAEGATAVMGLTKVKTIPSVKRAGRLARSSSTSPTWNQPC